MLGLITCYSEEKRNVYVNCGRLFRVIHRSVLGTKKHNCTAEPEHVSNHEVIAVIRSVNIYQISVNIGLQNAVDLCIAG